MNNAYLLLISGSFVFSQSKVFSEGVVHANTGDWLNPLIEYRDSNFSLAVEKDSGRPFDDFRVADSAVLDLAGVTTQKIATPATPEALAFGLIGADSAGENYAFEVNPYMLIKGAGSSSMNEVWANTSEDIQGSTAFYRNVIHTFTITGGRYNIDNDPMVSAGAGLGFRFDLLRGDLFQESGLTKSEEDELEEGFVRQGLKLSISGAANWESPTSDFKDAEFSRWGVWATLAFTRPQNDNQFGDAISGAFQRENDPLRQLSFLGVLRYTSDQRVSVGVEKDYFDVGTQLAWKPSQRFTVSAEYMQRFGDDTDESWGVLGRYQFDDNVALEVSYGEGFDADAEDGSLLLFGLKFGFSGMSEK